MYLYYIHHDLQSIKFDHRKLPTAVQKNLFATEQQAADFETIVESFITDRDFKRALDAATNLSRPKRKEIRLDPPAISLPDSA